MELSVSLTHNINLSNGNASSRHKKIEAFHELQRHPTRIAISRMVHPIIGFSNKEQDYSNYISTFTSDEIEQAKVIAYMIEASSDGPGTNEDAFRAAIFAINEKTYPLVEQILSENYDYTGINGYIEKELSEEEAKDLHGHLNQFR